MRARGDASAWAWAWARARARAWARVRMTAALLSATSAWSACAQREPARLERFDAAPRQRLAPSCPTPTLEVDAQQCQALPAGYGELATMPLEWGAGASSGRSLWFGRMTCASGGSPRVERLDMVGPAPRTPTSPKSPLMVEALDIVERWQITCPGQAPRVVYHNLYRCGSPCPPRGLELLPAQPFGDYLESLRAHRARRMDEAYKLASRAHHGAPTAALFMVWLAALSNEQGKHEQALSLYELALERHMEDDELELRRAETLLMLERPQQAQLELARVIARWPVAHPLMGYALCLRSTALMTLDEAQSVALARQSCALGESICCV